MRTCTRCKKELKDDYEYKLCPKHRKYTRDYKRKNRKEGVSTDELSWIQFSKKNTQPKGEFGKQLKKLMLEQLESPKTLAKTLGVDANTINAWLYNEQIPRNTDGRHKLIARTFCLDVSEMKFYK